ncbi:glycoside hydrolase family 38 C-terminal domain-containing protein [Microbacterium sp. CCNWLW134]|uniref:alpha-mannosidase n=1 Tax=Microbacterium sp. CCNWLW134 TaxID=3122064 RepID=UPI0030101E9B
MHSDHALVEARLRRFTIDHLTPSIYRDAQPLQAAAWSVPREPVPFDEAIGQSFEPVPLGWRWGRAWSTVWFRITGALPASWKAGAPAGTRVEVLVDFGFNRSRSGFQAEGLVYRPDGTPIKAIAPLNSWVAWNPADGDVDLLIEAAANPDVAGEYTFEPTPLGEWDAAGDDPLYELRQLEVALRDETVWELVQDVWTLTGLMEQLPDSSSRRHEILRALETMMDAVDPDDVAGTAESGRQMLRGVLSAPASASAHRILATGHAHIDSAWLWPIRETVRKCARTFTNVTALMDDDPDFVFSCSSAQQYAWLKEHHPRVYARIREKVAAGTFVPVGGMWVESDTNMPGSEALARQFVAGKRFFLEEFGIECEEAWLPDSFGYSAALPQIVIAAGERWFLTQKISWNQTNRFPHHTFRWEGIDGTRVFTHFPPVDTYISELSGAELAHAERNFSEKGHATMSLVPFGWGDGGGGPTREMLAAARRTADLEGSPRVTVGAPRDFFAAAEEEYPDAPVWAGEMYLELHRGVFTSQLRTKQGNRRNEALLREAELWATTASVRRGHPYPAQRLRRAWETVMLLQFHDILPGSAIAWVHREAEERHAAVSAELAEIIADALDALDPLDALGADESSAHDRGRVRVNASPFPRAGTPALGAAVASEPLHEVEVTGPARADDDIVLDNGLVRVVVDPDGHIRSLVSHADGRDAVPPGVAFGVLRLHRDLPNLWDAWDLDAHYRRTVTELTTLEERTVDRDAHGGAAVVVVRRFGASSVRERILLRPGAADLELAFEIDWREREKILKLAMPFDVHADRVAAETQFGHVFRPTHTNTSWDDARFEACQHRFLHLAEPGWGVAVANDSTYGYDVERQTRDDGGTTTSVRFSLLRAAVFPDPDADQGRHVLRFRVRPGAEVLDAVALGYDLAFPLREARRPFAPLVSSTAPSVLVETVKQAEDGSGDVIVRVYEAGGRRARTRIGFHARSDSVHLTDLLERELDGDVGSVRATDDGCAIDLDFRPFQFRTLRFSGVGA